MPVKGYRDIKVAIHKSHQVKSIKLDPNVCDANNDGKIDKKYLKMEKMNRDLLCPTKISNGKKKDNISPRLVGLFRNDNLGWRHSKRVKDPETALTWKRMEENSRDPLEVKVIPVNQGGMEIKISPSSSKFKPFAFDIYVRNHSPHTIGRYHPMFQGESSALRKSSKYNPRNLPCPTCKKENRLTPADKKRGYQCDECANRAERGCY